jgi:putative GTP pyrophosphokinase
MRTVAFSKPPDASRTRIKQAGAVLAETSPHWLAHEYALLLADQWRACHAYPINTFQATLRTRLAAYPGNPIVAQRLKRMPTIVDKLRRYPAMKLTTMQDIGGVRAILKSVDDVRRLSTAYVGSTRLTHELLDRKDYIANPRSEDGYRSIHLIYRYRNKRAPEYDGLRIEMQIRTTIQHIWATAVEAMGTFLGQALKSRQGDQEWLDFFALVSSAFAIREGCASVPRFAHLSEKQTIDEIRQAERRLDALQMMRGLTVAANAIPTTGARTKGWSYHLIVLNSVEKTVQVRAYSRESFNLALEDYSKYEGQAAKGKKIEPVLVSAGPLSRLRRAYPNFFLDVGVFARMVRVICKDP